MIGIGAANIAAGFFQGFPVSTSGSRTAVAEQSGAKTQVTGLVGALAIVLMLLFVPGLLRNLPQPTLAAVVIAASLSLADIPGTVRLWHQRREEFLVSIAAFLGVALLGVLAGIAVAVALSIVERVPARLVALPDRARPRRRPPRLPRPAQPPGRRAAARPVDVPLRRPAVLREREDVPRSDPRARLRRSADRAWIIVAAEPITDVDTTAADMLEDLDEELNARGVSLVFAEMKDPVREKIERYDLTRTIDPGHFFPTIDAAVDAFRRTNGRAVTGAELRHVSDRPAREAPPGCCRLRSGCRGTTAAGCGAT